MCLPPADPQDALRCLHVSRDEACLTVSFSRPILVSPAAFAGEHHGCGPGAIGADGSVFVPWARWGLGQRPCCSWWTSHPWLWSGGPQMPGPGPATSGYPRTSGTE